LLQHPTNADAEKPILPAGASGSCTIGLAKGAQVLQKKFFASKRNEICFSCASHAHARKKTNFSRKNTFRIEVKKILLPFRFISLRSENDGAP
jgi:hypothetical protein